MALPTIDVWATALIVMALVVAALLMRWWHLEEPYIFVSQAADYADESESWRVKWHALPTQLMIASLCFFGLAFVNPRIPLTESSDPAVPKSIPTRGLAFYLLIDHSGSMRQNAVGAFTEEGLPLSKMTLLKQVANAFITQRPNDLLGLVVFSRIADIIAPLTLDHNEVSRALDQIELVDSPTEDGTGIGYAIFKTVSSIIATKHFGQQLENQAKPIYTIDRVIIILLTDGFQSTNPLDTGDWKRTMPMEDAAAFAKAQDVKVYLINIDRKIRENEFEPHRNLLKRVAETTGGNFFIADSPDLLQQVFKQINAIETQELPVEAEIVEQATTEGRWWRLYPFFALLGLLCLGVSLALYTTILRKVP